MIQESPCCLVRREPVCLLTAEGIGTNVSITSEVGEYYTVVARILLGISPKVL